MSEADDEDIIFRLREWEADGFGDIFKDAADEIGRLRLLVHPSDGGVAGEPVAWHAADEVPPVKLRDMNEFILAVRNPKNGKAHTFAAHYLNKYPVEMDDTPCANCDNSCEDGDGCPLTGWYTLVGDGRYDSGCFYKLELREGRTLEGWTEVPPYAALPPVPGNEGRETLEKVNDALRKASLTDSERIADAQIVIHRYLSAFPRSECGSGT